MGLVWFQLRDLNPEAPGWLYEDQGGFWFHADSKHVFRLRRKDVDADLRDIVDSVLQAENAA